MGGMSAPPTVADRLMTFFWRSPADTVAERTRRRITLHLIPFLFFLYILAYLDRVNVSVAQLGMERLPTGTSGVTGAGAAARAAYHGVDPRPSDEGGMGWDRRIIGYGAGMFFWGYWILEIPSTITVVRWGARWVFARILVLWGLCAALVG